MPAWLTPRAALADERTLWSRASFKGTTALKRRINPTRVPIDQKESMRWLDNLRLSTELAGAPERCVHVGDRESDIYELYCLAEKLGTGFLVRSCVNRLADDGSTTIANVMGKVQSSGTHEIQFRDAQGKDHRAMLSIRHATMTVRPPIGKQKEYQHQDLQIIYAEELDPPEGRAPIIWKLITNLPVTTHADAVHKLEWYALRWKIETFFRTLKTGCRIEELRLATADRLANCIALCCVVAWRVSWLTMLRREKPNASPSAIFTDTEQILLESSTPERKRKVTHNLDFYVRAARAAGRLPRSHVQSATWHNRHMARLLPPRRPCRRNSYRKIHEKHLWVTASCSHRLHPKHPCQSNRHVGVAGKIKIELECIS